MEGAVNAAPLSAVKLWCTITSSAEAPEVSDLIASGAAYIDGKLGAAGDYDTPGEPLTLLKEYVRYGLSDALDVFETNYLNRLLAMQHERRVSEYAADTL